MKKLTVANQFTNIIKYEQMYDVASWVLFVPCRMAIRCAKSVDKGIFT